MSKYLLGRVEELLTVDDDEFRNRVVEYIKELSVFTQDIHKDLREMTGSSLVNNRTLASRQDLGRFRNVRAFGDGDGELLLCTENPVGALVWRRVCVDIASRAVSAAYTIASKDRTVLASASGGAFTVTLPSASSSKGRRYTIKKIDASANGVTVGGTVDGTVNPVLTAQYQRVTVESDGSAWYLVD